MMHNLSLITLNYANKRHHLSYLSAYDHNKRSRIILTYWLKSFRAKVKKTKKHMNLAHIMPNYACPSIIFIDWVRITLPKLHVKIQPVPLKLFKQS